MTRLAWIDLPYACFGLVIGARGVVVDAPPIARWTMGRHWAEVANYFTAKKGMRRWEWVT